MKQGIHPNYKPTTIRCACGAVIETGSTKQNITVDRSWSTPAAAWISSTRSTASSNRIDRFTEKPRCNSSGVFRCHIAPASPWGEVAAGR